MLSLRVNESKFFFVCVCKLLKTITVYLLQLRDCELAPGVNRDLARRVRNVNGITQHKQVLRNDIKLAAKLIHALDEKGDLWSHKSQGEGQSTEVQNWSSTLSKNEKDHLKLCNFNYLLCIIVNSQWKPK